MSRRGRPPKGAKQTVSNLRNQKPIKDSISRSPSVSNDSGREEALPDLAIVFQDSQRIDWEKEEGQWAVSDFDESEVQSEPGSDEEDLHVLFAVKGGPNTSSTLVTQQMSQVLQVRIALFTSRHSPSKLSTIFLFNGSPLMTK
jgi:hypothetical protein